LDDAEVDALIQPSGVPSRHPALSGLRRPAGTP
jgi:hypothetical protein